VIVQTDAPSRLGDLAKDPNKDVVEAAGYARNALEHVTAHAKAHPLANKPSQYRLLPRLWIILAKGLRKRRDD
jgi:hypothetical protein